MRANGSFSKKLLAFSAALTLAIAPAHTVTAQQSRIQVPELGVGGGGTLSLSKEHLMGDFYMREIRAIAPLADDPALREYLNGVGNRLVMHTDNVRHPFYFFWVNDPSLNAFAFLGGYVGIHTGILQQAQDESELASVISHEIAHVTQRHIARNLERMSGSAPMTLAQMIGGIVIGMVNPAAGMATLAASVAGAQQRQINYTRQFELEADRIGIEALHRAGFDPEGAPRFFGRLADQYRYVSTPPQLLITHPLPASRVADTRNRAMQYGSRSVATSLEFELAKARVRVRYSKRDIADTLKDLESELPRLVDTNKIAANDYGRTLALLALGNHAEAYELLRPLRAREPLNLFYLDTETDLLLDMDRADEAVEMLTREYIRRPNNQVVTLNLAYAANAAENYELSRRVLNNFLIYNKDDVVAWTLLLEAFEKQGMISSMHEARAEILALRGDFRSAVEELHSAISKTSEERDLTRQRLQARIEQFRNLEAERDRVAIN